MALLTIALTSAAYEYVAPREVEYRRHPDADYLLRVRITWRGQLVDELWLERAASPERWVIDHFEAVQ